MTWINVKDGLPCVEKHRSNTVLIVRDCGDGTLPSITTSFMWSEAQIMAYSHQNPHEISERWDDQESKGYRVTHWQPLPKLPEAI